MTDTGTVASTSPTANTGPAANTGQENADAPITGVTVFTDGARVTRAAVTAVPQGVHSLVVASLPHTADRSSVRVAARGHDLTLLNVEVQRRVAAEPRRESLAQLRADVERCRDVVRELDDADEAEGAGLGFLGHLSEAAATALARAVGAGRAGYEELSGMAGHLSGSTATTLARRREIAARKRVAQRELDAAVERLAGAEQSAPPAVFADVCVLLDAAAATEAEIELTYHVKLASWRPLYDLVLDGEKLKISYLAEITQRSGEDWPEVTLVLSTTRQGQRQTLPELSPWYIGRPPPPRPGFPRARGRRPGPCRWPPGRRPRARSARRSRRARWWRWRRRRGAPRPTSSPPSAARASRAPA
ncbi:MAG TPA: mucoidy inhibitor MuiA family protein [Trebonia sp.]|nr:mucoidy inhibitor MuiA family protein [Trebonia sp.]